MNPIIEKDLRHFWRPATQMKDYENFEPLLVDSARGSRLFLFLILIAQHLIFDNLQEL